MDSGAFELDQRVRLAAFAFLTQQAQRTPDGVLSRSLLATGFPFDGTGVPLIGPTSNSKPTLLPKGPCPLSRLVAFPTHSSSSMRMTEGV